MTPDMVILFVLCAIGQEIKNKWDERQFQKALKKSKSNVPLSKGIAILGMKGAGKTTLLNILKNKPEEEVNTTSYEQYCDFIYTKTNGNSVKIRGGFDIGGGSSYRQYYEDFIQKADVVFFLFDINRWKYFQEDRREIQSRLQFITEKCKANKKLLITLLTHADYLKQDELKETMIQYKSEICERDHGSYKSAVLDYPFLSIDTTDTTSVKQMLDLYL